MHSFIKLAFTCTALLSSPVVMAENTSTTRPTAEVFFEVDSSRMSNAMSSSLAALARWSNQHPLEKIMIDGHTDSSGTDAYNIGLSSRRTESVQAQLLVLGVPVERTYRGIYGENDVRRSTNAGDRRVTIWTTGQPLYTLANDLLGRTAIMWSVPATAAEVNGPRASAGVARKD